MAQRGLLMLSPSVSWSVDPAVLCQSASRSSSSFVSWQFRRSKAYYCPPQVSPWVTVLSHILPYSLVSHRNSKIAVSVCWWLLWKPNSVIIENGINPKFVNVLKRSLSTIDYIQAKYVSLSQGVHTHIAQYYVSQLYKKSLFNPQCPNLNLHIFTESFRFPWQ